MPKISQSEAVSNSIFLSKAASSLADNIATNAIRSGDINLQNLKCDIDDIKCRLEFIHKFYRQEWNRWNRLNK